MNTYCKHNLLLEYITYNRKSKIFYKNEGIPRTQKIREL